MIDGVGIKDQAAKLDGQVGVAFSISTQTQISEAIIDPRSGDFIGERSIALVDIAGVPPGSVTQYTTLRSSTVPSPAP